MKIYTKTGDKGQTSLFGGQRVAKNSIRIETYGTADELNSFIGLARSYGLTDRNEEIATDLQNMLFVLGADLATPPEKKAKIDRISASHIDNLESYIDEITAQLQPLRYFVLPTGTKTASALHIARTVCRRAERICIEARQTEDISEEIIIYLNRLSDLLFTMARLENETSDVQETKWIVR
ncbi:MAG: cob(I)yrinic acid a,c-diamide adenosyltransferase [Balneolales bacterium]|nr:cob(I)yrinic acid a,c-diamide adenosyltransferase [Balneolales bacterium]